jgi:hypothetical protein
MLSVRLLNPFLINFWMPELIFMKLRIYIMAPEPICTTYFINPYHQFVSLYLYPNIIARQRLGKNITTATNKHASEEFLDVSSSKRSVLYQRKAGD